MKLYNFFITGLIVLVADSLDAMQISLLDGRRGEVNINVPRSHEEPLYLRSHEKPRRCCQIINILLGNVDVNCNTAGSVASCVDALILSKQQLLGIVAADDLESFRAWFAVHTRSQQQVPSGYIELLKGIYRLADRYDARVIAGHIRLMLEDKVPNRY